MSESIRTLRSFAQNIPSLEAQAKDPGVSDMAFLRLFWEKTEKKQPIEDFARSYGVSDAQLGSFTNSAVNSVTLGFSDEIAAMIDTAVNDRRYEDTLAERRAPLKNYADLHPGRAIASDIVGTLVPGTAAFKGAGLGARGLSAASRVGRTALAEGAVGAAHGFGTGEGTGDRVKRAAEQGAIGALLGGAVEGAAFGGRAAVQAMPDPMDVLARQVAARRRPSPTSVTNDADMRRPSGAETAPVTSPPEPFPPPAVLPPSGAPEGSPFGPPTPPPSSVPPTGRIVPSVLGAVGDLAVDTVVPRVARPIVSIGRRMFGGARDAKEASVRGEAFSGVARSRATDRAKRMGAKHTNGCARSMVQSAAMSLAVRT